MIPFGFSAGDFAAGIVLLHRVIMALREADGASSQFNYTILELEGLQAILRSVQRLQDSGTTSEHLDSLRFLGHQCHLPLAAFLGKIREIEPELGVRSDKHALRTYAKMSFRKAQWGLQLKKHVAELKGAIAPQLATIGILLQLISLYATKILIDWPSILLTTDREQQAEIVKYQSQFKQTANDLLSKIEKLNNHLDARIDTLSSAELSSNLTDFFEVFHAQLQTSTLDLDPQFTSLQTKIAQHINMIQAGPRTTKSPVNTALFTTFRNDLSEMSDARETLVPQNALAPQLALRGQPANVPPLGATITSSPCSSTDPQITKNSLSIVSYGTPGPDQAIKFILELIRIGVNGVMLRLLILLPFLRRILKTMKAIVATPTMLLRDNIWFEDALGRITSLPYAHFRHFPVFMTRLQCEFKGLPGERKIFRNEFIVFIPKQRNQVVKRKDWDRLVLPGSRLSMSFGIDRSRYATDSCPRCKMACSRKLQQFVRW